MGLPYVSTGGMVGQEIQIGDDPRHWGIMSCNDVYTQVHITRSLAPACFPVEGLACSRVDVFSESSENSVRVFPNIYRL